MTVWTRHRRASRSAKMTTLGLIALLGSVACSRGDAGPPSGPAETGRPLHAAANFDPSIPGFVACSTRLLEGDVVRVVDGRPGRMLVTMSVDHWVKPESGPSRVVLSLVDIAKEGAYERWAPGTHLRLAVDVDPSRLPAWQFSAAEFAAFEKALPKAARLSCPYGPG
jgi:hypothetical protein